MTFDEFEKFLDGNEPYLNWAEDEEKFYFRDLRYAWYANHPDNCTSVLKDHMAEMTVADLKGAIVGGLKVEHISRVTGYFAKVNSWNPGKLGELRDRHRSGDLRTADVV